MSRAGAQRDEGLTSAGLFASYQPRIRRYIGSMVHDPAEVDDLTQETFLHAHRKLGSLRDPDAVVSWLYRIATHVTYDRHRRTPVQPKTESVEVLDVVGAGPHGDIADQLRLDRVLEQREMSACVTRYIEDLSTEYQQVIFLHDLEGLSNPEISEMLGASLDTVKIRLHRARRKLEAALSHHCLLSLNEEGVLVCEPAPPVAADRASLWARREVYRSSSSARPER